MTAGSEMMKAIVVLCRKVDFEGFHVIHRHQEEPA